jgi:hypothetical protein
MKYNNWRVYSYDVWGNAKEGFDVNDCFRTSYVCRIADDASLAAIVRALKRSGYLNKNLKTKSVDFSYNDNICNDTTIYFNSAKDGRPEGELRKEEE